MQLPQQHHKPSKPSTPSCCSSWIRRSPPPSPPHKKPGGGWRSRYVCRLVPLLVLTVYSVFTVLHIPSSSLVVTTADSERVERREDLEALKTHLPSNQNSLKAREETRSVASLPCSAFINGEAGQGEEGVLCCDRSHYRSDVCYLRGDVRTDPSTSSVLLYGAPRGSAPEKVRPYTRKFEDSIMSTIDEVTILPVPGAYNASAGGGSLRRRCDVRHPRGVPAVVFSTGGYTGNVYHEFSDGLIPLFITAQRFAGEVVFVVLEYHYWWLGRYGAVLERLTNHKVVDFRYDRRVHCFDEMIVGLRIHGELVVDPKLMPNGKGIKDFQALLHQGYSRMPSSSSTSHAPVPLPLAPPSRPCPRSAKPKLLIFIRKQNRVLLNLPHVVTACRRAGFAPHVMNLRRQTPLPAIHTALASADAMVAVHGAAVTHFLFMRSGSVLLQIVPVGLDWAADAFYGKPAQQLGLEYLEYKVAPEESSLAAEYGLNSTVVQDPSVISSRGWWEMKKVYMDRQNVTVNIKRFGELLRTARQHLKNSTACAKGTSAALRKRRGIKEG
ncbi:xylan glycosyltransferase MUCI21-like [Phragmites australis]|uniref:xylan glycosyltransferase MUCI21-like n=1 Tax=Phragmites australis TaxID=29695 RepID=UPI002D78E200|nr:xylan glycosyltransferase MUCI21-like [Phragmites australis]